MNRIAGPLAIVLAITALVGAAAWRVVADRATPATLEIAGRVYAEERGVSVPLLRSDAPTTPATPGQPVIAGRLASVTAGVGDHVQAGDIIATLSTGPADAALALARAQAAEASATVALLAEKADEAADGRSDLESKRADVRAALADLRTKRAEVAASLADARAMLESMPSMPATPSAPPTMPPGAPIPDLRAIVAQLEAALAQLDAGIATAERGLAKLDDARATVADAIIVLGDARDAAGHAATAARAGVSLAEARLALHTVYAPVSGIITQVSPAGSAVHAGAPLARIRPDAGTTVEAYVTSSDAALLAIGTRVRVSADYLRAPLDGEVTDVGLEYVYPPTMQATRDTHMVRGVRVRVNVQGEGLPPGAPVDIIVDTGR
ncbi:MAG: HlyD family secretion protein [Coriobacteriia bacterium]